MTQLRRIILLAFLLLLPACQSTTPWDLLTQTPPPAFTLPAPATGTPTPLPAATETESPTPSVTPTTVPGVRRVLILSIDGLRPELISLAPMPNLQKLMQTGAYTLTAQTVYPSVTLVSHASMLTGLCPAKHGVDWNDYLPENGIAEGTDLFDIAQAAGLEVFEGLDQLGSRVHDERAHLGDGFAQRLSGKGGRGDLFSQRTTLADLQQQGRGANRQRNAAPDKGRQSHSGVSRGA